MSVGTWAKAITDISLGYAASMVGGKISDNALSLRRNQVFKKNIDIKNQDWTPTEISIQRHNAKRRGLHHDVRMSYKKRMLSFVNDEGLKKTGRDNIIRTNDHVMEYADFEGTIPDGQVGAGTVKLVHRGKGLLHTEKTDRVKIKLLIPDGKYEGLYNFVQMEDNKYKVHRSDIPGNKMIPRHDYKLLAVANAKAMPELQTRKFVAEEKMDGAYASMKLGKYGSSITGRNESVKGNAISYNYKLPHLMTVKSDKYAGTILIGEVYSRKGPGKLTSILNSNLIDSNAIQTKLGKPEFFIFDINTLYVNGKRVKPENYAQKRIIINDINRHLSSHFIHTPTTAVDDKFGLYGRIVKTKLGEGIVIKSLENNDLPWYKVVKTITKDLKIIDITEGQGKYKGNGIGAFIVQDKDGSHTTLVGTGLNDAIRRDAYKNKENYIGKIVKVSAKEVTAKSLRAPRFEGIHPDKTVADNL